MYTVYIYISHSISTFSSLTLFGAQLHMFTFQSSWLSIRWTVYPCTWWNSLHIMVGLLIRLSGLGVFHSLSPWFLYPREAGLMPSRKKTANEYIAKYPMVSSHFSGKRSHWRWFTRYRFKPDTECMYLNHVSIIPHCCPIWQLESRVSVIHGQARYNAPWAGGSSHSNRRRPCNHLHWKTSTEGPTEQVGWDQ